MASKEVQIALIEKAIRYLQRSPLIYPPKPPVLLRSPISELEATTYYHGIPSRPVLVARTSTTPWHWADDSTEQKELRPVGDHPVKDVWEDNVAFKVHRVLDESNVDWTSTDVVRIKNHLDQGKGAIILWIGVKPTSLSGYDGLDVAIKCREILIDYGVLDVHVEIRESAVTRWSPPSFKFLPLQGPLDDYACMRTQLTTTLGPPVSAKLAEHSNGTGGFFFSAGGKADKILLVTARHVVFPLNSGGRNVKYERTKKSQRKYPSRLMSPTSYVNTHLHNLDTALGRQGLALRSLEQRAEGAHVDNVQNSQLVDELRQMRADTDKLFQVYMELNAWIGTRTRVFGHVILSPPLRYGCNKEDLDHEGYTSDWAIIEIDAESIDSGNFYGNVIDLRATSPAQLTEKLGPDFEYPADHLFRLNGTLSHTDIRGGPSGSGSNGLVVLKNGGGTGLTVGKANDVCSYARSTYVQMSEHHFADTTSLEPYVSHRTKEWAILPFDATSGSFAFRGDSGAAIADSKGRIGGMITGGTGMTYISSNIGVFPDPKPSASDITYATPIHFLLDEMKQAGLEDICLDPTLA